ncbi:hypothetical protein GCM10011579_008700 [Streptomyces albiflavescens]|uniref:Uncharacterized protein n=1 Tax=Streptomyces albiflavescens TaxID=1623582 RepID=A0A917XSL8_9ACTN|nr:hypothetical protein [Streptomyces albiflavescens]GGN52094.1 hypothetical protein GCM10011579_008700 [Streptomyces albiflavescens]
MLSDTTPSCPPPDRTPTPQAITPDTPARFGTAQAIPAVFFPAMGTVLLMTGTPMRDIFLLLGGCGAIAAAVVLTVSSGRRRAASLAAAVLRAAAGK